MYDIAIPSLFYVIYSIQTKERCRTENGTGIATAAALDNTNKGEE